MADILATELFASLQKEKFNWDLISFVPVTRKRQAWRGYNQAEELARALVKITLTKVAPPLTKKSNARPQVGLSQKERRQNLRGKLSYQNKKELILGKRILIIDDVVTTGSTLNECAKVYKKAGARSVWGAVIAKE